MCDVLLFQILSVADDTGKHFASLNYASRLHKNLMKQLIYFSSKPRLLNLLLCDLSMCMYMCVLCALLCVCVRVKMNMSERTDIKKKTQPKSDCLLFSRCLSVEFNSDRLYWHGV